MALSQLSPSNHPTIPSAPYQSSTAIGPDFLVDGDYVVDVAAFNALPPHVHAKLTHASVELMAERLKPDPIESHESTLRHGNSPCVQESPIDKRKGSKPDTESFTSFWKSIAPAGPRSHSRRSHTSLRHQQSNPQRWVQNQIGYLNFRSSHIINFSAFPAEQRAKETLRISLTRVAQDALERYGDMCGLPVESNAIALKCVGGLRNGLSLPGDDLDLMIHTRPLKFSGQLGTDFLVILARSFLGAGFGARVVPGTKGPVIKLCDEPAEEFLDKLKSEIESEKGLETNTELIDRSPNLSSANQNSFQSKSNLQTHVSPFPGNSGIQCNVNLHGEVHDTELIRCYALCDERIRDIATFVKTWAKQRGICNSHYGTLSSYGYVLMVIHFLVNIVQPPVVPNLQAICDQFPGRKSTAVVRRHEIKYCSDETVLRSRDWYNAKFGNKQCVGDLLRGFFLYYGRSGGDGPLRGHHWARDIISIRTQGGLVRKVARGWDRRKTGSDGKRIWNLLAVEDPIQHDNNVAASVSPAGIDAMKTEFSRALTILRRVHKEPGAGWTWRTPGGEIGQDLLEEFKPKPQRGQVSERIPDVSSNHQPVYGNRASGSFIRPAAATKKPSEPSPADTRKQTVSAAAAMQRTTKIPEHPKSNELSSEDLATQTVSNVLPSGVRIDPRQFCGPAAIRDRPPRPRRYDEEEDMDSEICFPSTSDCSGGGGAGRVRGEAAGDGYGGWQRLWANDMNMPDTTGEGEGETTAGPTGEIEEGHRQWFGSNAIS